MPDRDSKAVAKFEELLEFLSKECPLVFNHTEANSRNTQTDKKVLEARKGLTEVILQIATAVAVLRKDRLEEEVAESAAIN